MPASVGRLVASTQSGNWSLATTWGGLTPPGPGDWAIINHAVTVDKSVVVGSSPPPTPDGASSYNLGISTSTGAATCNLPTGTYSLCYSEVDAQGRESYRGIETWNGLTFTNGSSKVRVTFPALPAGIVSRNLYVTNTNGAYGTARLYATGITGTTRDVISASWVNGTLSYANAPGEPNAQAVRVNGGGALTVAAALTVRGDLSIQQSGALTLGPDSVLELDSSGASLPASTSYAVWVGNQNGSYLATMGSTATLGHRAVVRSNAAGANGRIGVPYNDGASALASSSGTVGPFTFTDFVRLGSASVNALSSTRDNVSFSFSDCTFQQCGTLQWLSTFSTTPTNLWFTRCTWTGTTGTYTVQWARGSDTGTDVFDHCSMDAPPRVAVGQLTITDCYLGGGFAQPSSLGGGGGWVNFRRNFVRQTINGGLPWSGSVYDSFIYVDAVAGANPHVMILDTAAPGDSVIDNNVSEFGGTDDTGDWLYSGTYNYTMTRNVLVPNSAGKCSFAPVNTGNGGSGEATTRITCNHNTWFVGSSPFLLNDFGIGGASHLIASLRSNIMWSQPGNTDVSIGVGTSNRKINDLALGGGAQIVDPIQLDGDGKPKADYNCGWGLQGSPASDYAIDQTTGGASLGAHDKDCVPGFDVAYSGGALTYWRNLATWAVHRGSAAGTYAGQVADALAMIAANPELGCLDGDSAWNWVRKGYQPKNTLLYAAGHDGVTIGAVEFDGPGSFQTHPRRGPGLRYTMRDEARPVARLVTTSQSYTIGVGETVAAPTDAVTRAVAFVRGVPESIAAPSDAVARTAARARGIAESIAAPADATGRAVAFTRGPAESVAAPTDGVARGVTLSRGIAESTAAPTDAIARAWSAVRAIAEAVTAPADAVARAATFVRGIIEAIGAPTDAVTGVKNATGNSYTIGVGESVAAPTDGVTRRVTFGRGVAESTSAPADAVARTRGLVRAIAEAIAAPTDTVTRRATFSRSISEALAAVYDSVARVWSGDVVAPVPKYARLSAPDGTTCTASLAVPDGTTAAAKLAVEGLDVPLYSPAPVGPISAEVRKKSDSSLVNLSAAWFELRSPSGARTTLTASNPSTGVYTTPDLLLDGTGEWHLIFKSSDNLADRVVPDIARLKVVDIENPAP